MAVAADVVSEADVVRMFETVDRELGTVTALVNSAGILETQMRLEDEVARAVLWLLSDEASYTTGSFTDVSGGR